MKRTIKGITYDSETAQPLCTMVFQAGEESISESIRRTPAFQYFLYREINGKADTIVPMSNDDIVAWGQQKPEKIKRWKENTKE